MSTLLGEPGVSLSVMDMTRVNQGDDDVDVEQVSAHSSSSRSSLTSSSVDPPASARTGSRMTPLR